MKNFLILFSFCGLLLSCNEDEKKATNILLKGSWNMETYVAFMPAIPQLNPKDIKWTFNGGILNVVNNVEESYPYMLASGIYDITFSDNIVTINNGNYYYRIEGAQLTLEHTEANSDGGPIMIFSRDQ